MKIIFITFRDATQLDITGPLEVLSRGPDVECCLAASQPSLVSLGNLNIDVDYGYEEIESGDVLVIPGGPGVSQAVTDKELLKRISSFYQTGKPILSVCTGALILGAAGILKGKQVATHWASSHLLETFGAKFVDERVCQDANIFSSAGVSAGIDASLVLGEKLWGREVVEEIVVQMQYQSFQIDKSRIEEIRKRLQAGRLKDIIENRKKALQNLADS